MSRNMVIVVRRVSVVNTYRLLLLTLLNVRYLGIGTTSIETSAPNYYWITIFSS